MATVYTNWPMHSAKHCTYVIYFFLGPWKLTALILEEFQTTTLRQNTTTDRPYKCSFSDRELMKLNRLPRFSYQVFLCWSQLHTGLIQHLHASAWRGTTHLAAHVVFPLSVIIPLATCSTCQDHSIESFVCSHLAESISGVKNAQDIIVGNWQVTMLVVTSTRFCLNSFLPWRMTLVENVVFWLSLLQKLNVVILYWCLCLIEWDVRAGNIDSPVCCMSLLISGADMTRSGEKTGVLLAATDGLVFFSLDCLSLSLPSSKSTFSQPLKEKMRKRCSENW